MSGTYPNMVSVPGRQINIKRTPIHATKVHTASSGKEQRVSYQATPRYKFTITYEFIRDAAGRNQTALVNEMKTVLDFFNLQRGQLDTFTFVDPLDEVTTWNCRFLSDAIEFERFARGYWKATVDLITVK